MTVGKMTTYLLSGYQALPGSALNCVIRHHPPLAFDRKMFSILNHVADVLATCTGGCVGNRQQLCDYEGQQPPEESDLCMGYTAMMMML